MAKLTLLLLFCQIITLPIHGGYADGLNLEDFVSSYMQQYGDSAPSNLPGLLNHFLGSVSQGNNAKDLAANLMGAFMQGGSGNGAENILSGFGSLLGGQNGQIDPSVVGSIISMFAQNMAQPDQDRQKRQANDFNLESMLNMASAFLGNKNGDTVLPLIMNAISSFSGPEAEKRAEDHKDHASFLPPYLEKAHLYWDLFINSDLGKVVWENSGMKRALKAFTGPNGNISFEVVFKKLENQSFRRHWIKGAAMYLTEMAMHVSKPEVYQKYLASGQYFINTYLQAQGLPKSAQFNIQRPEKSISTIVNHLLKTYMDVETDVTEYVKPALEYLKQTIKLAQTTSKTLNSRESYEAITDRVTDALNLDIIEPVLRVYRAYQHSVKAPHCQEHLMCLLNKDLDHNKPGLPGFKAGLTKVSSLVASAALSYQSGKGFWDLYNAIQSDVNCESAFPADCAAFHEHELKVTTEPYHNEL